MRRILLSLAVCLTFLPSLAKADEDVRFYPSAWADSSGRDGKGGAADARDTGEDEFDLNVWTILPTLQMPRQGETADAIPYKMLA